jgi:hypothetical protein
MTEKFANVDWDKLSPEEKLRVRQAEVWTSRVKLTEATARAFDSLMRQAGLTEEEITKYRKYLEEIVTSIHRKHDESVNV